MRISKKNEVYLRIKAEPHVYMELSDTFTFEVPGAKFMPQYRSKYWDGKIRLFDSTQGELPAGLIHHLIKYIESRGYNYELVKTKYGIPLEEQRPDPKEVVKEVKSSEPEFNRNLLKRVEELELSVRSMNCLKNDNIIYIGDLVQKSEIEMLRTPNFGRKSLNEIKEVLGVMSLYLGMEVPNWPPENIEELARKIEDPYN